LKPGERTTLGMATKAELRKKWRYEALEGISGGIPFCKCCGETRIWSLVFDHINGGGTQHRKANASNPTVRLVRRDYRLNKKWNTDVYQILCSTCNHGKRVNNNICPHEEEVKMKKNKVLNIAHTLAKVFVSSVISSITVSNMIPTTADGAKAVAISGLTAVIVFAYNWLNPNDPRYGITK